MRLNVDPGLRSLYSDSGCFHRSLLVSAAFLLAAATLGAQIERTGVIIKRYAELCAGCHGANLEGATASSLLDDVWHNGGDDESLAGSIRAGFPERGMPAWSATLPEKEIRAFVIYIRERRAKHWRENTSFPPPARSIVFHSRRHSFRLETWVDGFEEPWGIAFLPGDRAVVTDKRGELRLIEAGRLVPAPIAGLPAMALGGDFGLLDVCAHPDFGVNGWLYFSYTEPPRIQDGWTAGQTCVMRARLRDGRLHDHQLLHAMTPERYRGKIGTGCRLLFDRTGHLLFTIGDRNHSLGSLTQDLTLTAGKIHRVTDDGRIPADNPFVDVPGAAGTTWTFGHRHPQGLAIHPATGDLYATEHGPRGGDELNLIRRGRNYGWPLVTHGMNYEGTVLSEFRSLPGYESPVTHWTPSIAPCGIGFHSGRSFPQWKHHLFVASLGGQELRRLELDGNRVLDEEILFKNLGRIRHVAEGPDGLLYVLLPQRIARLLPEPSSPVSK